MAINYELLNKGGISLGTNFELLSEKPLDSRLVVPSLDGLQNYIDNAAAYEGLIAYVSSEKKHYEVKIIDGVLSYRPFGLTEAELNDLIANATTAAMEFKGATATLPEAPAKGDMYKVAGENIDIEIDGVEAKLGDSIVYDGEKWFLIPSGDDIEDTWRPVEGVNNDATLKFVDGDKTVAAVAADGTIKYNHATVAAPTDVTAEGDEKTRTYITAVETDGYGHITGYKTATENVEDTDTTYTFESQTEESSVYFNVTSSEEGATEQTIYLDTYSKNEVDGKFDALGTMATESADDFVKIGDPIEIEGGLSRVDITDSKVKVSHLDHANSTTLTDVGLFITTGNNEDEQSYFTVALGEVDTATALPEEVIVEGSDDFKEAFNEFLGVDGKIDAHRGEIAEKVETKQVYIPSDEEEESANVTIDQDGVKVNAYAAGQAQIFASRTEAGLYVGNGRSEDSDYFEIRVDSDFATGYTTELNVRGSAGMKEAFNEFLGADDKLDKSVYDAYISGKSMSDEDLKAYADGKDVAIAAAQAAADKAQEEVDALETYVGTIPNVSDENGNNKYADLDVIGYINKKAQETLAAASGNSSETAASVKQQLDDYIGENNAKVEAAEDAIDALEAASATHATKDELGAVDAKFANYNTTVAQKAIDDAQDAKIKAIADDYVKAADIADFETKENVKKVADDLAAYVESNDAALAKEIKDRGDADTALAGRITTLEGKFGTGEGTVEAQIAAAVKAEEDARKEAVQGVQDAVDAIEADYLKAADKNELSEAIGAEKTRAEGIEAGLRTDVDAIKGDYLKGADKTALQEQITANANAITLLTDGADPDKVDGVKDLIDYVDKHGAEVTGMKADIAANTKAIEDEASRADTAEKALSGRLDTLEAINHDAYVAADTALKTELNAEIAKKADASTVTAMDEAYKAADTALAGRIKDLEDNKADYATATEVANQDAVILSEAQKYADQAEADAVAAAKTETETQVNALAETVYTKTEVEALFTWGSF